jgi:hypothetical protein
MGIRKLAAIAAVIGMLSGVSSAATIVPQVDIDYISGTAMASTYDAGTGQLAVVDAPTEIVVQYGDNTQTSYSEASFSLTASLLSDASSGGKAVGLFDGGTIDIYEGGGSLLFSADLESLSLEESSFGVQTLLTGSGTFDTTAGSLSGDFGPEGYVVDIAFILGEIDDFSQDFAAQSNVTLYPIPEPATMSVLALGGLAALLRRRNR